MINQNLLLTGDDGYNLTNSLRFRASASAYLSRTLTTPTNNQKWTFSDWIKRGSLASNQFILQAGNSVNDEAQWYFTTSDTIRFYQYTGSYQYDFTTAQVFRDPSAWYHIVVQYDSTQATAANRFRVYVNGSQITLTTSTNVTLNATDSKVNSAVSHDIGGSNIESRWFDGYLTEINFIDGQALTPSSFGETSATTGVWIPKKYTGTYGTNGFYLPFTDNSALTTSSNVGLGKDFSGNANYWTTNNISITSGATYDSMTDVPTLTSATAANYAVMNPLNSSSSMTPSSGNLNVITSSVSVSSVSTISVNSGKWYCEITIASGGDSTILGIAPSDRSYLSGAFYTVTGGVGYYVDGTKFISGSQTSYGASYTTGDVIGIALDMDAGTVVFYKNNSSQGTAASGLTGGYYFAVGDGSSGSNTTYNVNFGQRPFAYTPPTGYVALNTFNLPTPTIGATASTQANEYFDVSLWTGNGSTQSISGVNFQPDFVWFKSRSAAYSHRLWDAIRGATKGLLSDGTDAEFTESTGLTSFNSDGFTVGSYVAGNNNGSTYVGWQWKANGTGSSNTQGTITSTVSANTSAGFSIVTYTGTGSNATVGHGLGVAPSMVIVKRRDTTAPWNVWHTSLTSGTYFVVLNTTAAQASGATRFTATPTSTVINIGTDGDVNGSGGTYVAYCFAQIAGYSAFGSYTGNGSSDGPFVFTGFRPRYVMFKRTDAAASWTVLDSARNTYNVTDNGLLPNNNAAEYSGGAAGAIDILSNGFKARNTDTILNANGGTYIYAAFAENPFKYANAR